MKRTAAILIGWVGYSLITYGWVLLKGFDITFVEWVNPVDPYVWPAGDVPLVAKDRVWPGGSADAGTPAASAGHPGGKRKKGGLAPIAMVCPPGTVARRVNGVTECVPVR